LHPLMIEQVAPLLDWLETLPRKEVEFISSDFAPFRQAMAATRFADSPVVDNQRALAGAIGRIAHERYRIGECGDAAAIDANYVRRSDAELLWKEG